MALAEAHAVAGEAEEAEPLITMLEGLVPIEADAIRARLYFSQEKYGDSMNALERAFLAYRTDPWPNARLMARIYPLVNELASRDKAFADRAKVLLEQDLAVSALRYLRLELRLDLALMLRDQALCGQALAEFEPHNPWTEHFLKRRLRCLLLMGDP